METDAPCIFDHPLRGLLADRRNATILFKMRTRTPGGDGDIAWRGEIKGAAIPVLAIN